MNEEQRKLAEENIGIVYFTIKKYFYNVKDDEDVIASGMEGLCIAAEGFDPERGKFSTYAAQCIRNCVRTELRSRQKHMTNVYLSNVTVSASSNAETSFEEYHGDDDPGYEDILLSGQIDGFEKILAPHEIVIFRKTIDGKTPTEIAEETGFKRAKVYSVLREIKSLWKLYRRQGR